MRVRFWPLSLFSSCSPLSQQQPRSQWRGPPTLCSANVSPSKPWALSVSSRGDAVEAARERNMREKRVLTCGPHPTHHGDMAAGSSVAVKTGENMGKTAVMANPTRFVKFDGQRFLVLEFDGQNQTHAKVRWPKIDFFLVIFQQSLVCCFSCRMYSLFLKILVDNTAFFLHRTKTNHTISSK